MLSKAEVQYLQGQKQVSDSYEYKLKSILKKKITNFLDKELPLLTSSFPNLKLTKISKNESRDKSNNLTKYRKRSIGPKHENISPNRGNFHPTGPNSDQISDRFPKYYINNPSSLIETAVSSGGVEVIN